MARKIKIENLVSQNYEVRVTYTEGGKPWEWYVRNRITLADTDSSKNFDTYRELKRVWRKSKEDFDSACRFMKFRDLFSYGSAV